MLNQFSAQPQPEATPAAGDEAPLITAAEAVEPGAEERPPERQYCVFRAGRERFCLAVLDVEEVADWPAVTRLPLAPPFVMGIFNLRGSIVPVIDIAFAEGRRPDLTPYRVVVAKCAGEGGREDMRLGIAADEVFGTYSTSAPELVEEAPRDVPHCCGMLRHGIPVSSGSMGAAERSGAGAQPEERLALVLDVKRVVETFPVPNI
jgi:purine-binding chemotaxis protein CheW